jgi:16S rRNA (uracil1498-N3)-methyltransferase
VSARRFFVEGVREVGSIVEIDGSDAHKIVRVLRLRDGDAIEVIDSTGTLFAASIAIDGARVRARVESRTTRADVSDASLEIDVAQAMPKGRKMDAVVEKTTELGVAAILPYYCERTVARNASDAKLERWRRIAKSAAQQSGRVSVPEVRAALPTFESLLERFGEYDAVLFPWELAPPALLRDSLPSLLDGARRALIVIGPEGGFAHEEAEKARLRGAALLWLGPRILRTETAAMALLAIVDAFTQRA